MGTLHHAMNVLFGSTPGDWLPARLVFYSSTLDLAPNDYVIYYQAQGLSGHTSPRGECAFSHFGVTTGDWLSVRLVFYFSSTLDPDTT